jgi:hypothetical protein
MKHGRIVPLATIVGVLVLTYVYAVIPDAPGI